MAQDKRGVSAMHISRELNLRYATAWTMLHKLRQALADSDAFTLKGVVEADETYYGGKGGPGRSHEATRGTACLLQSPGSGGGKSFVNVTGRFAAELAGRAKDFGVMGRLAFAAKTWRSSLERIARTTTHQSANLVREAVGTAIS